MNKILFFFDLFLLIISGCSSDDDVSRTTDDALSGALTSATNKQLEGRWAILKSNLKVK
jgi:hypothetical protein